MNEYYRTMTHRVSMALGDGAVERLSKARVIIFGVGGVGSWCAEALVRTGMMNITLADPDVICPTNVNRQVQATSRTVGLPKAEELRNRLLDISPRADIAARYEAYCLESANGFDLASYDFVIDAIDSVMDKALLLEECVKAGVTVFSSMGAAARTDPSRIKTAPLSKTHGCPLARSVRRRLRERNVPGDFLCVYSDEPATGESVAAPAGDPSCGGTGAPGRRVNGSLVHITGIFGFALAGLVIGDIARRAGEG